MWDRFETYGSAELWISFINDEEGKLIKTDSLFENLYDFWTCFHAKYKSIFIWYHPKMAMLEKTIRKKWEKTKDLHLVDVILNKIKEKDEYFNPIKNLEEDEEKYFEVLQHWKADFERNVLEKYPHLHLAPVRHKKCLVKSRRPLIR